MRTMWRTLLATWISVGTLAGLASGQTIDDDMPREITDCVYRLTEGKNQSDVTYAVITENIHTYCMQQFMWKFGDVQWGKFNITEKEQKFVNSLIGSLVHRVRVKRQVGGMGPPPTGFRIRREYRRLTDGDRHLFHETIRRMKASGLYDLFANWHSGLNVNTAHGGPNFPGWHRIYLVLFEEAMRQMSPGVPISIPYWDSTLDFHMVRAVNSIIWSESFLGNGDGRVVTGPFAGWMTSNMELTRNIGRTGVLFTKDVIRLLLTRCSNADILPPTALGEFDFDRIHGGPHNWVGGQMGQVDTAAHDPVFFLHHAFVDYIWEMFRIRQATFCGVNPELDYPPTPINSLHAPVRPMAAFPQYRVMDGLRNYWTQFFYRYESSPSCSTMFPSCGTPYLQCDLTRQICVSVKRIGPNLAPETPGGFSGFGGGGFGHMPSMMEANAHEARLAPGRRFNSPPPDPRTREGQMLMGGGMSFRRKREAANHIEKDVNTKFSIGQPFAVRPPKDQTVSAFGTSTLSADQKSTDAHLAQGNAFPIAVPLPLLPLPEYHDPTIKELVHPNIQNNYMINGVADRKLWAFIPVKVIFFNNQQRRTSNSSSSVPSLDKLYLQKCAQNKLGVIQARVESNGINYSGTYINYALIDSHLPKESVIVYIGIKSPEREHTEAIISAVYSCGNVCKAYCVLPDSSPPLYQPCTGILRISATDSTVDETTARTWNEDFTSYTEPSNLPIYFHCFTADKSMKT